MIKTLSKQFSGTRGPRVLVAAFGKHPAWDDHIEDVGLATDELVEARRTLYAEAIARNIDSGTWGKPDEPPPAWLVDYGHMFLWRTGGSWIVGRLWPSRDGRKRTKYPMAVCAQCDGVGLNWIAQVVLPRLERLQQQCIEAVERQHVISAVTAAQQELTGAVGSAPAEDDAAALRLGVDRLLSSPIAEGTRTALYRVQYQIERELAAFFPPDKGATFTLPTRGQHVRVPAAIEPPTDSLVLWTRYVRRQLHPDAPLFVSRALNSPWVDIAVGELSPQLLFPIRADAEHVPPASDVPYTINDDAGRRYETLLDAMQGKGAAAMVAPPAPAPVAAPVISAPRESAPTTFGESNPRKNNAWIGLGIAGALLIVAIIIAAASGVFSSSPASMSPKLDPKGGSKATTATTNKPATDTPKVAPSPEVPAVKPEVTLSDPRANWDSDQVLRDARNAIASLPPSIDASVLEKLAREQRAIADDVDKLMAEKLTAASVTKLPAQIDAVKAKLAALRTAVSNEIAAAAKKPVVPVEPVADLPERASSLASLQALWSKQLDVVRGLEKTPERLDRLRSLRGAIDTFEQALPQPAFFTLPPGRLNDRVLSLLSDRRERAAAAAAAAFEKNLASPATSATELKGVTDQVATWASACQNVVNAFTQADAALNTDAAWNDQLEAGATLATLSKILAETPAAADLAPIIKPLQDRLNTLAALATSTDRVALRAAWTAATSDQSTARTATDALFRLTPPWPQFAGELAEVASSSPARARLDAERQKKISAAVEQAWLKQWGDPVLALDVRRQHLELLAPLGIDQAKLPAWAKFNVARMGLDVDLRAARKLDDVAAKAALEKFIAAASPLEASLAGTKAVEMLSEARRLQAAPPAPKVGPGDLPPAQGGEGRAKWNPLPDVSPDGVITYTLAVEGIPEQRISFAQVQVNGKTTYISTTEMSVGTASAILSAAGRGDLFANSVPDWSDFTTKRGLKVWQPAFKRPVPLRKAPMIPVQAGTDPSKGWLVRPVGMDKNTVVLADPAAPGPDWATPIQAISAESAAVIASAMNARLPSVEEWQAALAIEGSQDQPPNAQLRGQNWKKQRALTKALRAAGTKMPYTQDAAFVAANQTAVPEEADDEALDIAEPALFLSPVDKGCGTIFKNLIGNVAEYVLVDAVKYERFPPEEFKPKLFPVAQELRVIGGSAFSHPSQSRVLPLQPTPTRAAQGFSDVGFRLAFSAERGVAQQLIAKQALGLLERYPAVGE